MLVEMLAAALIAGPAPALHRAPSTTPASAVAVSDPWIMGFVAQVDAAEVEMGKLAIARGTTPAMRDYGRMLVTDHQKSLLAGRALARKLDITPAMDPDTSMARDHAAEMVKLHGLSGAAFDKEFAHAAADGHQAVIDKFNKDFIPDASHPELKVHLREMLPTLQKHENAAKALE